MRQLGAGGEYRTAGGVIEAGCLRCPDTPCARFSSSERGADNSVADSVCVVNALREAPEGMVVTDACFGCGLCVTRCGWGAIRFHEGRAIVATADESYVESEESDFDDRRQSLLDGRTWSSTETQPFVVEVTGRLSRLRQSPFYEYLCALLTALGIPARASRHGDTSLRMDAVCPHAEASMPVEIKSPTESLCADLKSVRQALENAVIMRARETDPTTPETPSLAIGFDHIPDRSDARELADDIEGTYGIRVRILATRWLLAALGEATVGLSTFDADAVRRGEYSE